VIAWKNTAESCSEAPAAASRRSPVSLWLRSSCVLIAMNRPLLGRRTSAASRATTACAAATATGSGSGCGAAAGAAVAASSKRRPPVKRSL
jgi:hypothetical protein